jgi:flagellar protein FlgJ
MTKQDFFAKAVPAAIASGHLYPLYAVCEAALESAWGESELAREAANLFGQKVGFSTAGCEIVEMETRECLNGKWCTVSAAWPKFIDWQASFKARMALLNHSNLYAAAVSAPTGEDFIREVSKHWSTDPQRAEKVLETYRCNWNALQNASILAHKVTA